MIMDETEYSLHPVGIIRSTLKSRQDAPKQGNEGAPDAWLEINPEVLDGLRGIAVGDEVVLITWLHRACRETLLVHPRGERKTLLRGVFSTRSPDRPNPVGL